MYISRAAADMSSTPLPVPLGTLVRVNRGDCGEPDALANACANVGECGETGGEGDGMSGKDDAVEDVGADADAPRQGYFWKPMSSIAGAVRAASAARSMW